MVEEGKIPSISVARVSRGEVIPTLHDHKTMVFEVFFDASLSFPALPLLEGVLRHFYVELP